MNDEKLGNQTTTASLHKRLSEAILPFETSEVTASMVLSTTA